jgi:sugar lactone lactonase YvrE
MLPQLRCLFFLLLALNTMFGYSQAPIISYTSAQTFTTGTTISALSPSNSGGAVPATIYGQVSTFAGTAGVKGKTNGIGTAASFSYPQEISIDATGNLYVIDNGNNLIRKITPAGQVSTLAGSGAYGATNGPGISASFYNPNGITTDGAGNVFVSEVGNELIRKITNAGVVSTFAGQIGIPGSTNGQGTQASFFNPLGLATDNSGNIFVADYSNYLIRKITPVGLVSTYAGKTGIAGSANGPVSTATFTPFACAVDGQGNVYVADGNSNIIRKITPAGLVSTLAGSGGQGSQDGIGTSASFYQPAAISIDAIGNVYVAENGNNIIRKITPAGVVTTIAGTAGVFGYKDANGIAAKFFGPAGLTIDTSGNIYFSDLQNQVIRKLITTGYAIDKPLPTGLVFDPTTGSISGIPAILSPLTNYTITAYNTSGSSSAIIKIGATGTMSFDTIPSKTYGSPDFSPAISTAGVITYTSSNATVATIVAGNIHILSVGKSIITATNGSTTLTQTLTVTPAALTLIAGNKSNLNGAPIPALTITYSGFVNKDTIANLTTQPTINTTAIITSPHGSYPITVSGAVDTNYTINYIAGTLTILGGKTTVAAPAIQYPTQQVYTSGMVINPITPSNTGGVVPATVYAEVSTLAGTPGVIGSANGTGAAASFNQPYGITADSSGNLYVTEQVGKLIRKITPAGIVSTFAGSGLAGATNGPGTTASFGFPSGIIIDTTGNLYVADQGVNLIRKITPQGLVSTFAGGGSSLDGQGTQASFFGPLGISADKYGNLYVADTYNFLIRKITSSGLVTTLAGMRGVQGFVNGLGTAASFTQPSGIATDATGNIYVTDDYLIRKITPTGVVSTFAGTGASGSSNGTGTAASFGLNSGLAVDQVGNVYVADQVNNVVRKITPGGVVTTIAGLSRAFGSADGIGTSARFNFPNSITTDAFGNLYIVDEENMTIRKIVTTGYSIDKPLPAGLTFDPKTGIISGTPTTVSPATNYTISAYNIGGGSTAIVNLAVNLSNDATISTLTLSSGVLNPAFTAGTSAYTASVSNSTSSITVSLKTTDANATVNVNGTPVTNGLAATIPLSIGSNTITSVVTAQDGTTTNTYTINVNRAIPDIYNLPPSNFQLAITSASCKGSADGSINITAVQNLNYTATITGNGLNATYPFSTSLNINNLSAGSYSICLNIAGQTNYQQCYDLAVKEPQDLAVYTTINTGNTITLNLDGGSQYNIKLNGALYTTANNSITLPLQSGNNELTVTTDRLCQGTVNKSINYSDQIIPYPVPFQTTLNLNIGNSNINNVSVEIHNLQDGKLVYSNKYVDQSGVLQLDLTGLTDGVYALYLTMDNSEKIFKILKQ